MIDINIFPGRFSPFHLGHLKCCQDGMDKNGCPSVIFYISNTKFDQRHPFSDKIIENELNIVKETYPGLIQDIIWIKRPMPTLLCRLLYERGYSPKLWLAGSDRINNYKNLIQEDKIKEEFGFNPLEFFETKRYCSATDIRKAILDNNLDYYLTYMPKNTGPMFNIFKEELLKIK